LSKEIEKIDELINRKKIKKIVFIPSKVQIWIIKSIQNNNVYWIDLDKNYCSCKGFYYNYNKKNCYHINAVSIAHRQNKFQIEFLKDSDLNYLLYNQIDNIINNNI
jgi:predicted nucleic acid-binding Zn finger protein